MTASVKASLFGGDNGAGDCCNVYYDDTWTWDGVTWTQQFPQSSPSARTLNSMAYDPSAGKVILFGGFFNPGNGLDDTWTWDGAAWAQIQTTSTPSGRWSAAMDFDGANKSLMLFGGEITGDPFYKRNVVSNFVAGQVTLTLDDCSQVHNAMPGASC